MTKIAGLISTWLFKPLPCLTYIDNNTLPQEITIKQRLIEMNGKKTVVFDFDGTIVSKNTGAEFYKWMAKKSIFRVIILILLLPVLIPLRSIAFFTNDPYTQLWGLNIVCIVSTMFQKERLLKLRSDFIDYYFGKGGAVIHKDAIARIKMHQQQGDEVIIITGCPLWILSSIIKRLGIKNAALVGTSVSMSWHGLLLKEHCHQKHKVSMASDKGYQLNDCTYGYSDSTSDIPMLKHCQHVVVVNPNRFKIQMMRKNVKGKVSFETWK